MRQSERNPQFWVELNGGQAGPVGAAQDLDDATEIAEADGAADAANEASGAALRTYRASSDAATAALDEAKAQAAEASIAGLTRWIDDNRQAATPLFDGVVAALDRFIETSPATPVKPVEEDEIEAKLADPIDPTLLGFIWESIHASTSA